MILSHSSSSSSAAAVATLLLLLTVLPLQQSNGFITTTTTSLPKTSRTIATTTTSTFVTTSPHNNKQNLYSPFSSLSFYKPTSTSPLPFFSSSSSSLKMSIFDDLLKTTDTATRDFTSKRYIDDLQKRVLKINELEPTIEDLSDDELVAKTNSFRQRLQQGGEDINGPILEETFATVREAAWRVLEQRHYDVQLLAGMILNDNQLAEMATGEGKTLVATLPAYLQALAGKTSLVITVNDYLAKRDFEKMGQVLRYLGLTVGLIQSTGMTEEERRVAYSCDVVYVTNSELGFDYLRDHLALSSNQMVLPQKWTDDGELNAFCIVDEADSVLIDEARTPLIISKQVDVDGGNYKKAFEVAEMLQPDRDYKVDIKNKNVIVNENGYDRVESILGINSVFTIQKDGTAWAPYINNACKAKELFNKDVEYAVTTVNGREEVGIIDSFTGRVLEGRRWSDGLHQSIEALEGLEVSQMSQVIAKVTYQALFRQFAGLSAMTGTAITDADEFGEVYGLSVIQVPTALPLARRDYPDSIFKTRKAANDAVIREVQNVGGGTEDGRPCLIGTTSVIQSRVIVDALKEMNITAAVLNASPQNAAREGELIAQAGRPGVVTVATNIAGRGTDILLGGCPTTMSRIRARAYLLEKNVLNSTEAELLPVLPDESYYPCDINEEETFLLDTAVAALKKQFGPSGLTALKFGEILTIAADTTESDEDDEYIIKLRNAVDAIKDGFKEVLAEEKEIVRKLGGLYVMGTNRHDSSRIDNQLRGRAGRQGDAGSSRFFLSFEDEMFVTFGGDGLQNILKAFRVSDDMPVEAESVSKSLDAVQETVETKFKDIRDEIRRFDEVLNSQRKKIYQDRRKIVLGTSDDMIKLMKEYNEAVSIFLVDGQVNDKGIINVEKVYQKLKQFFPPVTSVISQDDLMGYDVKGMAAFLNVVIDEVFDSITKTMEEKAKASNQPPNAMSRRANYITLVTHDNAWSDHLQNMEVVKETVGLRQYQMVDPFIEYQQDAFTLYQGLLNKMKLDAVYSLWQSFK